MTVEKPWFFLGASRRLQLTSHGCNYAITMIPNDTELISSTEHSHALEILSRSPRIAMENIFSEAEKRTEPKPSPRVGSWFIVARLTGHPFDPFRRHFDDSQSLCDQLTEVKTLSQRESFLKPHAIWIQVRDNMQPGNDNYIDQVDEWIAPQAKILRFRSAYVRNPRWFQRFLRESELLSSLCTPILA